MTRTRSTRSTTSSSLVHSPANLATPAPSPTSPTLMSAPASASASASPATEPANPAANTSASKPVRRTQIAKIGDERLRRSALLKRRHGLYKKATELATLCDCQVAILIFDSNDRLHHYSTTDNVDDVLLRYASHYRPALDVRTAREYGGSPELGTRPSTGANFMAGNVDAPNPSTFANQEGHMSNLLGFNPSDPTPVDADAMMYNLVDDDGDDDDLAMVTSPIFTPATAPSDPFGQQQSQHQQQMILSESGANFIQPSPLNRQFSSGGHSTRRSVGIPIPTPLQIPMGHSPLGGGTIAMSPMSLPTQSPFFSAFDMMAINSPRMPASATTPTDPTTGGGVSTLSRVPSTKKRRIDAVMHSDSAYVPNSPMFTPSLLASQPLPPLPPSVRGANHAGMSVDATGSFASTSTTSWLGGSGGTIGGAAAASPFQLPFTQTPTEMAADLMYSMPPSGTMPALPGNVNSAGQFMSPMTIATGTPMQVPMMTPLTMPSDTFMHSTSTSMGAHPPPSLAGAFMPPPAATGFTATAVTEAHATTPTSLAVPATSGPLRLPPTRSLSAVFPDISLSEYLHAHPPHSATGESGEALMGTLAWDAQADVALATDQGSAGNAMGKMGPPASSASAAATVAAHAMAGQQFHPERVMSLDTILNSFSNTTTTTASPPGALGQGAGHQLQQASSIFDFGSGTGGRCVSPGGLMDDPEEMDEDVDLAPAAGGGEGGESEEEKRRKNVMAWPLLG